MPIKRRAWRLDLGFFLCAFRDQVFSCDVPQEDFDAVLTDFQLLIARHEGPLESATAFLRRTLRGPPRTMPPEPDTAWYRRQADRFRVIAPIIQSHAALAEDLSSDARRNVFRSFAAQA